MDKFEHRAVIKYLHLKGLSANDIHMDMLQVLGDTAPSYSTVTYWLREFERGRSSTADEARSGRPSTSTTETNIDNVNRLVLKDRRYNVRFIAQEVGLPKSTVHEILKQSLGLSKVCQRWVPRILTTDQKELRVQHSRQLLALYERDPKNFLSRFVTVDETWVHHFHPTTKQESKVWTSVGTPGGVKARVESSSAKVMATVFWDAQGVILLDFLQRGHTITGDYYKQQITKCRQAIKDNRRGMLTRGVLFHQDNAPAHTSCVAMAEIQRCGFELLPHPAYSPDLAPSDFHLFPNLKKYLRGVRYSSDDEVMDAVQEWFGEQETIFYQRGIEALQHRWNKCVALQGDYIEKQ